MDNDIELRSEKIRSMIGQIPPRITKVGLSVMFTIFVILLFAAIFFKFERIITMDALLTPSNEHVYYELKISIDNIAFIEQGQKVVLLINDNYKIETSIQSIDFIMHQNKAGCYYKAFGSLNSPLVHIDESILVATEIYIGETNTISYLLK